jgi:hypothetical protein
MQTGQFHVDTPLWIIRSKYHFARFLEKCNFFAQDITLRSINPSLLIIQKKSKKTSDKDQASKDRRGRTDSVQQTEEEPYAIMTAVWADQVLHLVAIGAWVYFVG